MLHHQKLSEMITDALRESIIGGEYQPGEKLREDKIALAHKTSRTPVREALRHLEAEGLIVLRPRRGAIVAPVTAKDIRDYYELQGLLASYAAKRALYRLSEQDLASLDAIVGEFEANIQTLEITTLVNLHNQFHEIIIRACDNHRITALAKNMVNQFQRFSLALNSDVGGYKEFVQTHRDIVKAIRERNEKQLEFLIAQYSGQNSVVVLKKLEAA